MKKYTDTGKKDTRSGFGAGLAEVGRKNPNVVAYRFAQDGKIHRREPYTLFSSGNS